jgi:putative CocE/NonD family hydrolase
LPCSTHQRAKSKSVCDAEGKPIFDFLEAHVEQQAEHPRLAFVTHRVDQRLVAVAQVDRAPDRRLVRARKSKHKKVAARRHGRAHKGAGRPRPPAFAAGRHALRSAQTIKGRHGMRLGTWAAAFLIGVMLSASTFAAPPIPPSDIPASFIPVAPKTDFILRELMVPMRDGVKLHTVIVMPKTTRGAPMLLTRTPYGIASAFKGNARSIVELLSGMNRELVAAGYILVAQDIRGRFGSEGDYRLLRPRAGTTLNPTKVDESTDAWDTIDWLVKNVPQSSGRVGIFGGSYGGFTTLMAEMNPHPALKAAVPFNSVVDVWTGDDLFHHGAFRQTYLDWVYSLVSEKSSALPWPEPRYDAYETWLAGSAGAVASAQGMDKLPFWQRVIEHPAYDAYWQEQAVDKQLAAAPLTVPTLHIHSQWDQEDIYGPMAAYAATEAKDKANDLNFLVIGPWRHGGGVGNGSELGAIKFGADTGLAFRQTVMIPFLDRYLKDGAPKTDIAPVTVFETGSNIWHRYDHWPLACAQGCATPSKALYLQAGKRPRLRSALGRRHRVRRICLGSRQAGHLSAAPVPTRPMHPIRPGAAGWSTISASPPTGPTC